MAPSFILRWDQLWSLSSLRWRFLLTPMTVIPANDAKHRANNARVCVLSPVCGASLSPDLSVVVVVVGQTCQGLSNDLACLGSMGCLGWMAWLDCLDPCCHPVFLCLECRLDRLDHRCLVFPDLDLPDLGPVFPDQACQLECRRW